jgi:hypothetical protein
VRNGYVWEGFCYLVKCSVFLDLGGVIISKTASQPIIPCVLKKFS